MPNPNSVSPGANGTRVDFSQAPGADTSWDDLFPSTEGPAPPPQASAGINPPQNPPQAPEQQPFLKAGESVYLTAEEAARGIEHKDSLVAKYRDYLSEHGVDPNTLQSTNPEPQAQPQSQPQTSHKWLGKGREYFTALSKAAQAQDMEQYERITGEYQQERLQDFLAPYQPLLAETARQRAIRSVSSEIPDFEKFVASPDYKKTLDSFPLYREMIQIGENNPVAAQRLPEVYKSLYLINQGFNRQQAVSNGAPVQQTQAPVQNPPRPQSMAPSTLTPPQPGVDTRNWTTDKSARKQLLEDGRARGIDGRNWSELGL